MCPAATDGMMGACVEDCMNDMDCEGKQKCCSNGCGHMCVNPMPMRKE
jgi:hypothetical protein